ncbi:MAG: hypothetical protein J7L38_02065, partial [Thermoproteales archaeon]|nr:hypothetical protein [Thermoproteales archaeon]
GEGDDVRNSDPLYTWGGLLSYIGMQELVMIEPWSGCIRFGNLCNRRASLRNYRALGAKWDIESSDKGITVIKDGVEIVRSTGAVTVNVEAL